MTQIVEKGTVEEIDTVTRATCSSNAIIEGCRKALEAAKRPEAPDETEAEEPAGRTYADGDYTVSVVCEPDEEQDFEAYDLSMTVSIQNDRITDITISRATAAATMSATSKRLRRELQNMSVL